MKKLVLLAAVFLSAGIMVNAQDPVPSKIVANPGMYPKANVNSIVYKYKAGNFTGCLQEGLVVLIRDSKNPLANYYVGLAYARAGDKENATKYLDLAAASTSNATFIGYTQDAKACMNGEETCKRSEDDANIEAFLREEASTGTAAPKVQGEKRPRDLELIKQKINSDTYLNMKFHENQLAMASDQEILNAIRTLKDSGVSISVNMAPTQNYGSPEWEQMQQMQMFGGGNNNNNNNALMTLLPMMMNEESAKNVDPQVIQAIMMQQMMPDFGGFGFNNNK
jgi:hypothetical protein